MAWNDAMMVSSGDDQEKPVPLWLRRITSTNFYSPCKIHLSQECNLYCSVCMIALCKECKKQHNLFEHIMIKAYKVGKEASFKVEDLKSLWDISDIRLYTFNECLVAYIYKRGAGIARSQGPSGIAACESCWYRLKSPGIKFCSVECKIEAVMKMNEGVSMKHEAKRKVETMLEENASNVQSFRKQPRKQKYPQRAPFF